MIISINLFSPTQNIIYLLRCMVMIFQLFFNIKFIFQLIFHMNIFQRICTLELYPSNNLLFLVTNFLIFLLFRTFKKADHSFNCLCSERQYREEQYYKNYLKNHILSIVQRIAQDILIILWNGHRQIKIYSQSSYHEQKVA